MIPSWSFSRPSSSSAQIIRSSLLRGFYPSLFSVLHHQDTSVPTVATEPFVPRQHLVLHRQFVRLLSPMFTVVTRSLSLDAAHRSILHLRQHTQATLDALYFVHTSTLVRYPLVIHQRALDLNQQLENAVLVRNVHGSSCSIGPKVTLLKENKSPKMGV